MLMAGAFARRAESQLTAQLDVGSAVRRERATDPLSYPARFDASARYRFPLGTLTGAGQWFSGMSQATRSDVIVDARYATPGWSRFALQGVLGGASSGTRLTEGVRRDATAAVGGVIAHLVALDVEVTGTHSWFESAAVTPHAQSVEVQLGREVERGLFRVGVRRVRYPDAFVATYDTTYVVAGFPYRGSVERLEDTRRTYGEVAGAMEWSLFAARIGVRGGVRLAASGVPRERWGRGSFELPLLPWLELVAEAGRRLSTPEQRLPGYRFGSLGLRVRHRALASPRQEPVPLATAREDAPSVEVDAHGRIVVRGLVAASVEVMGDFTDWKPAPLDSVAPGRWQYHARLSPGVYHLMIRIAGGVWQAPPGLPVLVDDLEQQVGLLVVAE